MNDQTGGFAVSTEALDHYVNEIVNPALDNFEQILSKLRDTTAVSHHTMLGERRLRGSSEFTDSCAQMLDTFFETHHAMTDMQRNLVQTVTNFRATLQQSAATYTRTEAEATHRLGHLSARLDGGADAHGTP